MRPNATALAAVFLLAVGSATIAGEATAQAQDPGNAAVANVSDRAGAPARNPANDASGPAPIYSRQTAFVIPFAISASGSRSLAVLLYVSTDFGNTWTVYARQPATQGQFVFRAAGDGEYWFASRTIAPGAAPPAARSLSPELRVVVDTKPPRLEVQASATAQGEIHVSWVGLDDHLAPETLRVEYRTGLTGTWRPVTVPQPARQASRRIAGETHWRWGEADRMVSVRVAVRDKAGNVMETTRRVIVPFAFASRLTPAQPVPASSVPSDPLARYGLGARSAAPADSETPDSRFRPGAADSTGSAIPTDLKPRGAAPSAPAPAPNRQAKTPFGSGTEWKPDAGSWPHEDPWSQARTSAHPYPSTSSPVGPLVTSRSASSQYPKAPTVDASSGAGRLPAGSDAMGRSAQDATGRARARRQSHTGSLGLPPGERPHMTKSKRFNLDYSIDAIGPMGVEKVELWVTRNGGRDWDLWGVDEDRESPFLVEVEDEGIYGFRIVIVGKNGLASQSPKSGDLADLWVGVDTTSPIAEITSAAYGTGAYAGHLDIQWRAMDDHLGARPITLQFSERRNGDWTTIASGLPNTGQYYWRVDSRVPKRFYLRLLVRDEAGNETVDQLDRPIESAGLTPKGRVRGFEPLTAG